MLERLLKWTLLSTMVGILAGAASYAFLTTLNLAIAFRQAHQWMIIFLPLAGVAVAWVYVKYGHEVSGGNNLILDEIHEPKKVLPLRMASMIFISSTISHLFGASVGREGAAVQMGASLADQFSRHFGKYFNNRTIILMAGMSAGFASIFGTPITGAVFGLEIFFIGSLTYQAFYPCIVAATVGYYTAMLLGISHVHYGPIAIPNISFSNILFVAIAAICFGLISRFFVWSLHSLRDFIAKKCPNPIYRPFIGGVIMIIIFYLFGTDRYQSIGQEIINNSFKQQVYPWDFLAKIFTTSVSLGSGFKGGEVMSLFYIGATLGNALSLILPLTISFLAALGFVSVFAGASNAPITCFFLAIRLFGLSIGFYAAVAVFVSYLVSGHKGIYRSRRRHRLKRF